MLCRLGQSYDGVGEVPKITYNVSSGTLNPAIPYYQGKSRWSHWRWKPAMLAGYCREIWTSVTFMAGVEAYISWRSVRWAVLFVCALRCWRAKWAGVITLQFSSSFSKQSFAMRSSSALSRSFYLTSWSVARLRYFQLQSTVLCTLLYCLNGCVELDELFKCTV